MFERDHFAILPLTFPVDHFSNLLLLAIIFYFFALISDHFYLFALISDHFMVFHNALLNFGPFQRSFQ